MNLSILEFIVSVNRLMFIHNEHVNELNYNITNTNFK